LAATSDNNWQKSDQLVLEIHRLVRTGATGTLFVRTADDHLGCVVFASGEIVSVMFRGVRGMQGIEYVRSFNESTFRFDDSALLWEDPGDLPDTQEILRKLSEGSTKAPPSAPPASNEWSTQPLPQTVTEPPAPASTPPPARRAPEPTFSTPAASPAHDPSFSTPPVRPVPDQPSFSTPAARPNPLEQSFSVPPPAQFPPQPSFNQQKTRPARQVSIALSATELKRTVCETAMSIMGPLGKMICEEEFARAGILRGVDDLERLLRRVAAEIDDESEAREFLNIVMAKATPREGPSSGQRAGLREGTPEYRKLRDVVESEAVEFLGPLAAFLCDEYFRKYSMNNKRVDVGMVINSLVDEIGDLERAHEFRERIAQRLG